ncbi:MAG TPA: radical SAM protein [Chloroflexota bacterium]|nr:radical SAM protein [Chloroflexota bacterium]
MVPPIIHEIEARSAINAVRGMPFKWSLNPYKGCVHGCGYCYARAYHGFLGLPVSTFDSQIFAKTNIAAVLEVELHKPSWAFEPIAIGTATDPYQRFEGQYRLTRACLETLARVDNPGSVTTKGTLVTRDVDVLADLASRTEFAVNVSLITLDREIARTIEPGAPAPMSRLRAIERLGAAGIPVSLFLAPVLPGITDAPEQIEAVVRAAAEHGARDVWAGTLRLAPDVREHFFQIVARHFPQLRQGYQRFYSGATYAPTAYQLRVEGLVGAQRRAAGLGTTPTHGESSRQRRGQLALPI